MQYTQYHFKVETYTQNGSLMWFSNSPCISKDHIPLGPSSLSMGNGPGGTAPGPFPLIVILRGGAVPPNSGAVPPPLYITIRGNGPGAVPPGPFPMDKLDGPSGIFVLYTYNELFWEFQPSSPISFWNIGKLSSWSHCVRSSKVEKFHLKEKIMVILFKILHCITIDRKTEQKF